MMTDSAGIVGRSSPIVILTSAVQLRPLGRINITELANYASRHLSPIDSN